MTRGARQESGRPFPALLLALMLSSAIGCQKPALRVHAAASLTDALAEAGRAYAQKNGVDVAFNFGGSRIVARQVIEGAGGDVFIAADEATMDDLQRRGSIDPTTRRDLLSNALVIVVPRDSALPIAAIADLARPDVRRVALGDPAVVPAGAYARDALIRGGAWDRVAPKVIPTDNVRAALVAVETGNADAAIVYRTDAAMAGDVRAIPVSGGIAITYPGAVLANARDPEAARAFLEFLSSPEAKAIFTRHGFVTR